MLGLVFYAGKPKLPLCLYQFEGQCEIDTLSRNSTNLVVAQSSFRLPQFGLGSLTDKEVKRWKVGAG